MTARSSSALAELTELPGRIYHACFALETAQSPDAVRAGLRDAADAFGLPFFLLGARSGRNLPMKQLVVSNYSKRWQRRYDELGAWAYDPVLNTALQFRGPFRWDGLHTTSQQIALRAERAAYGMSFGFTTSRRDADGSLAILSFCGAQNFAGAPAEWEQSATAVTLLVSVAQRALSRLLLKSYSADSGDELRDVELRCLRLIASGVTAEQAARQLGVTKRTVWFYLDRAALKLKVSGRRAVVQRAISLGLIDPRPTPALTFANAELYD